LLVFSASTGGNRAIICREFGGPELRWYDQRLEMTVTDAELTTLASTHDIISLGAAADEVRRQRHGTRTTFVRVAVIDAAPGAPVDVPPAAGELRISGVPASRAAACQRVLEVVAAAGQTPVSAFSLADLEEIAATEHVPLRAFLEELAQAGLELVSEAPFDRLRDPRLAVEEVNIAGLALARLTIQTLPSADVAALYREIAALQHDVGVIHAFAPLQRAVNPAVPTTGYDDVKRVALARLFVSNIASIPGGLVTLRSQTRAGCPDCRCGRVGRGVAARRHR
jgi:2-iminoacetate synthase ThiH